jgi:hypothetical protein
MNECVDMTIDMAGIVRSVRRDRKTTADGRPSAIQIAKKALGTSQIGQAKEPGVLAMGKEMRLIGFRAANADALFKEAHRSFEVS